MAESTRSKALQSSSSDSLGGVGLIFCRDPASSYLLVKEVIHDGPAFQSSLIYPGDKLCCINDFDLAWSGNVPREQQPQLPGPHGSNVVLTFDRSLDPASPERFAITLTRNNAFFPDKLTGSLFNVRTIENSPSKGGKGSDGSASVSKQELPTASRSGTLHQAPYVQSRSLQSNQNLDMRSQDSSSSSRTTLNTSLNTNGFIPSDSNVTEHANGGKFDSKFDYKGDVEKVYERSASLISDRENEEKNGSKYLSRSMVSSDERNHLIEIQQENKYLQDTVKALRKDLTDCHVQITYLQRQLKAKAEEAAANANEAAFAEKNLLLLQQKELEVNDLQGKLSKEKIQREAAERKIANEKEENQKLVSLQQDMKVRIDNFQEMLVKETLDRQKVQKKLSDAEQELQTLQNLKHEYHSLQRRNEDMSKELQDAKQSEQASTSLTKALQEDNKSLQSQNEQLSQELSNLKQQLADLERMAAEKEKPGRENPEREIAVIPDNTIKQADSSIYDVFISTGTPQPEHERAAPPIENEPNNASHWGIPNLQSNSTSFKSSSKTSSEAYPADVELHQSPSALRNESWRQAPPELKHQNQMSNAINGRGPNITFTSAPLSPNAKKNVSSNSPSPIYVSQQRLEDSPSMLYQKENFPSMYGAPAEYLSSQSLPVERLYQNRAPPEHQVGQGMFSPPINSHQPSKMGQSRRAGIGMSFNLDPVTRCYVIKEVHPLGSAGQAAANGDLLVGDVLLAVNGFSCDGQQINDIINLIVGPLGSEVQLTLKRRVGTEDFQITLTLLRNRPLAPAGSAEQRPATTSMSAPPYAMEQRPAPITISPPKNTHPTFQMRSPTSIQPRQHPSRTTEWERSRLPDRNISGANTAIGRVENIEREIPLPPGWIQETDPSTGRIYFVNHNLKTFCWNRPG